MSAKQPTQTPCPTCGKPVIWTRDARWRPFCSERCRLIDLGAWLNEDHRISEPVDEYTDADLDGADDGSGQYN